MPSDFASARRGSPGAHPCALVERARILRAPASRLFLRALAAAERGPGKAERGSPCRRGGALPLITRRPLSRLRERARVRARWQLRPQHLLSGPSEQRRRADGPAACPARGRREGSRRFGCRPWMACQPNPSARREPLAQRGARIRGCRFLWLLSFGQAKESDRPPWMADETHTDVSRLSRKRHDKGARKTKTEGGPSEERKFSPCAGQTAGRVIRTSQRVAVLL